jgi:hypothetical protein
MPKTFVEMQTMTYNPPTAQVTSQKDVTYGSVQPRTKSDKKKINTKNKKTEIIINPSKKDIQEKKIGSFSDFLKLDEADYWHPDPDKDRKLSNRGAKLRAREDKPSTKKVVVSTRKLKPGESYMDYAKRKARGESYVPGKPAEKVGALTNIDIPQSEREAAKQRLLAKAAAKRKEREQKNEETDLSKKDETKFHVKLDKLVHKTFGSSPEEKKKMKKEENQMMSFSDFMEARRSEKEGKGSPEHALSYPGRETQKKRGDMGGRHWQSGGEGGSKTERGRKKSDQHSQAQRLRGLSNYPEKPGKYTEMQRKRRGGDIGSRFD